MIDLAQLNPVQSMTMIGNENLTPENLPESNLFISLMDDLLINENSWVLPAPESEKIKVVYPKEMIASDDYKKDLSTEDNKENNEEIYLLEPDNYKIAWFDNVLFEPPSLFQKPIESFSDKNSVINNEKPIEFIPDGSEIPAAEILDVDHKEEVAFTEKMNHVLPLEEAIVENSNFLAETWDNQENVARIQAQEISTEAPQEQARLAIENQDILPSVKVATASSINEKLIHLQHNIIDHEWSDEFNQQILWLGKQKISSAILKLNPEELGPLHVTIKMVKENATIHISTQTRQLSEVIEQTIPRLRDIMMAEGLNLGEVIVDSHNNQRQQSPFSHQTPLQPSEQIEEELTITSSIIKKSNGIIDYFA